MGNKALIAGKLESTDFTFRPMRPFITAVALVLGTAASHAELSILDEVAQVHGDAQRAMASHQYGALLVELDAALESRERLSDGRWKLNFLLGGLRRSVQGTASPEAWAGLEAEFGALAANHPASPNGWLLAALIAYWHGWAIRGPGMADTVSTDANTAYRDEVKKARALLDAHPAASNPAWHDFRLQMATELGESNSEIDHLFATAIHHEPAYQPVWISRLNALEPKWGGHIADVVAFINQAARATSPSEGRGMAARLLFAANLEYDAVLADPALDWTAMRASMEDLVHRYPDESNVQMAVYLACGKADKAEAAKLVGGVQSPPSRALLRQNADVFGLCVDWARGKIPSFGMRDHESGRLRLIQ